MKYSYRRVIERVQINFTPVRLFSFSPNGQTRNEKRRNEQQTLSKGSTRQPNGILHAISSTSYSRTSLTYLLTYYVHPTGPKLTEETVISPARKCSGNKYEGSRARVLSLFLLPQSFHIFFRLVFSLLMASSITVRSSYTHTAYL